MPSSGSTPQPVPSTKQTIEQVKDAHRLLTALRDKLDRHPELEQAIEVLEELLNTLTVKTGAML